MENKSKNRHNIATVLVTILSVTIAIASIFVEGILNKQSSKCKFDIETTKTNITSLSGSGNISSLTDAIIAEAEGDYLKCLSENSTIFSRDNNKQESLKKYEEAQILYDSLRVQNNEIKDRIDKLQFELNRLRIQLREELEGRNSSPGYGPRAAALRMQSDKYQDEITTLQRDYSDFEKTYLDNMLRLKSKIIELK